jgi:hypothetical protein
MIAHKNTRFSQFALVACVVAGMAGSGSAAFAGFEWTPAPAPVSAAPAGDATVVPVVPVVEGPLTPEPDVAVDALPVPVAPVDSAAPGMKTIPAEVTKEEVAEEIVWKDSAPESAAPAAAPVEAAAPATASVADATAGMDATPVQGFGKEIPLALALRQIVPAHYAFAFASGEYAGRKVSWQGGKPWWQVLNDTLVAAGLQAVVSGNVVTISEAGAVVPAPVVAEPASMPVAQESAPAPAAEPIVDAQGPVQIVPEAPAESQASAPSAPVRSSVTSVNGEWKALPGDTLRATLEGWGKTAGVEVEWMTPYDYPVGTAFTHKGPFSEAVESMLSLYSRETPRPRGRLYPNLPEGPAVLMIN